MGRPRVGLQEVRHWQKLGGQRTAPACFRDTQFSPWVPSLYLEGGRAAMRGGSAGVRAAAGGRRG